jgi:DNA-directed RNA polymerase specialized sigma24 family protein
MWLERHINWKTLRGLVYKKTGDAVIGSEIVQELYRDMLQWAPEELHGLRSPQTYANMALVHRIANWRMMFPQADLLPDEDENASDEAPSMEEGLETREQVVELLAELPTEWVEPLIWCKVYGYSAEAAAERLNLTADAVKMRVLRALNYLRMLVAAPPPETLRSRVRNFLQCKERHHGK